MSHGVHLDDDHLVEAGLCTEWGEPFSPAVTAHLAACDGCRARYSDVVTLLARTCEDAVADADAVFTAERLQHQRDHILRRIEHLGRRARVIRFPGRRRRPPAGGATRLAPRWLAAAAAAGLFVGVAVGGQVAGWGRPRAISPLRVGATAPRAPHVAPAAVPAVLVSQSASDTLDDEKFLKELEFALERRGTQELVSFDALTPHVREMVSQVQ